jgi:hypothetical protein
MRYAKLKCAGEVRKRRGTAEIPANMRTVRRWARVERVCRVNRRVNYRTIAENADSGGRRPPRRSQFGLGCGGSRYRAEVEVTHPLHVLAHRRFRTIRIARRNRVRYRLMVLLQRTRFKSDRIRKSAVD